MKEFPILLLIILYAVFTSVRRKKKREAEEAKRRAEAQAAASATAAPGEGESAPIMPASSPTYPAKETAAPFDPFFGGLMEAITELASAPDKKPDDDKRPATASAPPAARKVGDPDMQPSRKAAPGTTLAPSFRHTLEASSLSGGHAHMESSMTGIEPACETPRVRAAAAPATVGTAFSWNAADARQGLVLSEILGKPKALRR